MLADTQGNLYRLKLRLPAFPDAGSVVTVPLHKPRRSYKKVWLYGLLSW